VSSYVVVLSLAAALAACSGGASPQEAPGVEGTQPGAAAPTQTAPAAPTGAPPTGAPSAAQPARCADPAACPGRPVAVPMSGGAPVAEASGLVASRDHPGSWWVVDDGGGAPRLALIAADGTVAGRATVTGWDATDVEDLAVGPCGAATCLYLADIGDNVGGRATVRVARVPEDGLASGAAGPVEVATYERPPADAEALLVTPDGRPLVITKDPAGARLLAAAAFGDGALTDVGEVPVPESAAPLAALLLGNVVTAADWVTTPDGPRVLLRTYDHAVEYTGPSPAADLEGFPAWPATQVPVGSEGQGEAIAYLPDGGGWATIGEGAAEMWVVQRPG
ncbi:MAG: hypothetical protein KY434_05095, partial [Actinobacteria bacterium]|nr:hypothetical protein [Actinomycetota bacterium]